MPINPEPLEDDDDYPMRSQSAERSYAQGYRAAVRDVLRELEPAGVDEIAGASPIDQACRRIRREAGA